MELISTSGMESLSSFSIADHVELAANKGFSHFEMGLDIFQTFQIPIDEHDLIGLLELKREKNLTFSCHLPYFSLDLAVTNQHIRKGTQNAFISAFQNIKILENDIEVFVLHPIGENTSEILKYLQDSTLNTTATELVKQNAIEGIQTFLDRTGIVPDKVAIENLEFPLEPTLDIIKKTHTKLCLDTAHLLGGMSGNWDLCQVLIENYDLIAEIHLQDYFQKNPMSDHAALGTSGLFPNEFIDILVKREFSGPVVFELTDAETQESIEYIQQFYPNLPGLPK